MHVQAEFTVLPDEDESFEPVTFYRCFHDKWHFAKDIMWLVWKTVRIWR